MRSRSQRAPLSPPAWNQLRKTSSSASATGDEERSENGTALVSRDSASQRAYLSVNPVCEQ